ncbi:MAG: Rieske 2Fe-2S domain-containing protein [Rhodospirillaceae bacterium]|jgi:phthalate 4,5-dioxygenase|nr:Rieske 2Fe-2S domain-containing protein [Rhodospirillaceae bacterium]MBT4938505.1 Rieske 2Fe-2S domain-containing protein [Rhodospirillaceae bacterium]MBT5940137.1 Rieske 2Fe-2S domain-containing protein [Rhodospirillaceae bacterium]
MAFSDSEAITRVGPGTPMGELMRRFWLPAAMSSEVEADGDPLRLMLLGEKLIAFRDTSGKVGIMDHRCPHRCASFFFGRNEGNGITCVYHGWKFDAEGNCIDMPNVPEDQDFKHKVKAKAYKTEERNGLIWIYMGKAEEAPALPALPPNLLPEEDVSIRFILRECNWLQAMEGDLDTSHVGFLHAGAAKAEDVADKKDHHRFVVGNRAPDYNVKDTDWGVMYGAHRPADKGETYWRIGQFLFPFWTMQPAGKFEKFIIARGWVPMDDEHMMFVVIRRNTGDPAQSGSPVVGLSHNYEFKPNTTDWYGRWRLVADEENDYLIDREVQKNDSYSGIEGLHIQDQAMCESMGAITDHSFERLAPSDIMITQVRKRLLLAARAYVKDGSLPPCAVDPSIYQDVRSGNFIVPEEQDWLDAYREKYEAADKVEDLLKPAAE